MSPRKKKKKKPIISRIYWEVVLVLSAVVVVAALIGVDYFIHGARNTSYHLSAEALGAYKIAITQASNEDNVGAAITTLENAVANAAGSERQILYTKAKLSIYKADIMLTYGFEFQEGFDLLGSIYENRRNSDDIRSEALMLAMAHGLQGLDEGALTTNDVRDFLLLNKHFSNTLGIGLAGAMLIKTPEDTYEYLARGFGAAADLTKSDKVYLLARSYSLRLLSPFMVPPPTGGLYSDFVSSLQVLESDVDTVANMSTAGTLPYQEHVASAYYNLARAYEMLPPGTESQVDGMARIHQKLSVYLNYYTSEAAAASAYLTSIDTRLVCKVVDSADFDTTRIDKDTLQPYLNELYDNEGWVVPCKEAFEAVAKEIDPRFAKFF